ncbi:MAG: type II/IV secretion system ATPase subunit, partial [Thermoplasmatota archaeon]
MAAKGKDVEKEEIVEGGTGGEESMITMEEDDIVLKDKKTGKKRSLFDVGWLFRKEPPITKKAKEEDLDPEALAEMKPAERMRYRRRKQDREQLKGNKLYDIPPLNEKEWEIVEETYVIREPYSYTRMVRNKRTKELMYEVIEPPLNSEERYLHDYLKSMLEHNIEVDRGDADDVENEMRLRNQMRKFLAQAGRKVDIPSFEKMFYYLSNYFLGYGRIQVMMEDSEMEDVSCDGTGIPIFVFHRKYKNTRTSIVFEDEEDLDDFVVGLAQRSGKHISIMNPILDATLPDGSRLNATFGKEITTKGSSFTIRKFKEDPLTMVNLILFKTLSPEMAAHLWMAVQYGDSMIVSGGTASGKTTTLNAVSHFIPPSSKIITIEDTREMQLPHLNWIAGLTRERKTEGTGSSIDMYTLLTAALRQRPEYMIVGEVRGKETMAVFQAMATGQVTYATIHADSVAAIVHRLENPPISCPRILLSALNNVIIQKHARVGSSVVRRIIEMVEIVGFEP